MSPSLPLIGHLSRSFSLVWPAGIRHNSPQRNTPDENATNESCGPTWAGQMQGARNEWVGHECARADGQMRQKKMEIDDCPRLSPRKSKLSAACSAYRATRSFFVRNLHTRPCTRFHTRLTQAPGTILVGASITRHPRYTKTASWGKSECFSYGPPDFHRPLGPPGVSRPISECGFSSIYASSEMDVNSMLLDPLGEKSNTGSTL